MNRNESVKIRELLEEVPWLDVREQLGEGGMGQVFRAYDRRRDELVAVKTLRQIDVDADAVVRFKREFRSLAELRHPNLAALYRLGRQAETWFFTMEHVVGRDFKSHVWSLEQTDPNTATVAMAPTEAIATAPVESASIVARHSTDTPQHPAGQRRATTPSTHPDGRSWSAMIARLRQALFQLARAVTFLHRRGRMHRDLKPMNVLVESGGDANARVVVLDFGLVRHVRPQITSVAEVAQIAGTVPYMAPEQAQPGYGPEVDWYAVGVMLYEVLTGLIPFDGPVTRILLQKASMTPTDPRELEPRVPDDLAELCLALMSPDPTDRPSGAEVMERSFASAKESTTRARAPELSIPGEVPFVGREDLIAELMGELRSLDDSPRLVGVSGPSGAGKTTLVEHFLRRAHVDSDPLIVRGKCYEGEAVPYKLFDPLIDELSFLLKELDQDVSASLPPEGLPDLERLFPSLRSSGTIPISAARGDRGYQRSRAFRQFRELLSAVASTTERPLVLALDDAQWADPDSAALFAELLLHEESPPVFWLLGLRLPELTGSPIESTFRAARQRVPTRMLEVNPLSTEAARELTSMVAPGRDESELGSVIERAGGNAFLLVKWLTDAEFAPHRLEPTFRASVEIVSVALDPVPMRVLLDLGEPEGVDALTVAELAARNVFRIHPEQDGDRVEPYHDRIRAEFLAALAGERESSLNRRLAVRFAEMPLADPAVVGEHFWRADDRVEAAPYLLAAAEAAEEKLAFARAAGFYGRYLEADVSNADERPEILARRARCLSHAGHSEEAGQAFVDAATASPLEQTRLERFQKAADQYLRGGHLDEGEAVIERTCEIAGHRKIDNFVLLVFAIVYHRARLWLRGYDYEVRDESECEPGQLLRIDTGLSMALGLGLIDIPQGALFQHRTTRMALEHGDSFRVLRALTAEAAYSSTNGRATIDKTERLLAECRELAASLGSPEARAYYRGVEVMVASNDGRFQEAATLAEPVLDVLTRECVGMTWEIDTARLLRLWGGLFAMESFGELVSMADEYVADARARGDLYAESLFILGPANLGYLALDRVGEHDAARVEMMERWSQDGYHLQHAYALMADVNARLYVGDVESAWNRISTELPGVRRSLLLLHTLLGALLRDLFARAALSLAATLPEGKRRRSLVRKADRWIRQLERSSEDFARGWGLLQRAALLMLEEDRDEAYRVLERTLQTFDPVQHRLIHQHAVLAQRLLDEGFDCGWGTAWSEVRVPQKFVRVYLPVFASEIEPR